MNKVIEIAVGDVVFDKGIYPRFNHDPSLVQKYVFSIGEGGALPPITINQHNTLLDGWHRWTAYKSEGALFIPAHVVETDSVVDDRCRSIELNAKHGWGLSNAEKKEQSVALYAMNPSRSMEDRIVRIMGVSKSTVANWLRERKGHAKKQRDRRILDLWLACHTQKEIADAVGVGQDTVSRFTKSFFTDFDKIDKISKTFDPDFATYKRDLYDVWRDGKGKIAIDQRIMKNLLALYTKPGDIVIDPFAGRGSTIDACRQHFRRYWVSDLNPIVEREHEIRKFDVVQSLPDLRRRWSEVSLVFLSPPSWDQSECLDAYHAKLFGVLSAFAGKLPSGAKIVSLLPHVRKKKENRIVAHAFEMSSRMRAVDNVSLKQRICVVDSPDKYTEEEVEEAKRDGLVLILQRELTVWEVR